MMTADNTSKVELLKYRQEDGQQSQVGRMTTDKTGRMGSNTVTELDENRRQTDNTSGIIEVQQAGRQQTRVGRMPTDKTGRMGSNTVTEG
jgi:5-hydroxyisourate hydrolase-like protein (transthyretin family)